MRPVRAWALLCGGLAFAVVALVPLLVSAATVATEAPSVVASLPVATPAPSAPKPRPVDLVLVAGIAVVLAGVAISVVGCRAPARLATRRVRFVSLRAPPRPLAA